MTSSCRKPIDWTSVLLGAAVAVVLQELLHQARRRCAGGGVLEPYGDDADAPVVVLRRDEVSEELVPVDLKASLQQWVDARARERADERLRFWADGGGRLRTHDNPFYLAQQQTRGTRDAFSLLTGRVNNAVNLAHQANRNATADDIVRHNNRIHIRATGGYGGRGVNHRLANRGYDAYFQNRNRGSHETMVIEKQGMELESGTT